MLRLFPVFLVFHSTVGCVSCVSSRASGHLLMLRHALLFVIPPPLLFSLAYPLVFIPSRLRSSTILSKGCPEEAPIQADNAVHPAHQQVKSGVGETTFVYYRNLYQMYGQRRPTAVTNTRGSRVLLLFVPVMLCFVCVVLQRVVEVGNEQRDVQQPSHSLAIFHYCCKQGFF